MKARYAALVMACVSVLGATGAVAQAPMPTAAGLWQQVDDHSGKTLGWFLIYRECPRHL